MSYKEFDTTELTEIDSVGSFIKEIQTLREKIDNNSVDLYFRGQEVEFWDIEPSIFRNDMLSIEHNLMQIPLQRIPMEFKDFDNMFDIMAKYQHYGMCTRLLDLTTNPLVALYFACKKHGNEDYDVDGNIISQEPYGVIYYTDKYYPSRTSDIEVRIVSALASYDLSKNNSVIEVLERLKHDGIIDDDKRERWLEAEHFREFVTIIQSNYMVIPTYSNVRLGKQSGVFLLSSLFTINKSTNIGESTISKSKSDLREEFSKEYFYINGENKDSILKELDMYNINEATLFPELEHQLNHIRHINQSHAQSVADFSKYEEECIDITNQQEDSLDDSNINNYIINELPHILDSVVSYEDINKIKDIIASHFSVDWYKRPPIMSKIRMSITGYFFNKTQNKEEAKSKAMQISAIVEKTISEYIAKTESEA